MSKRQPTKKEVTEAVGWMLGNSCDDFGENEAYGGETGCNADFWWRGWYPISDTQIEIVTQGGDHFIVTISKPRRASKGGNA